MASDFRPIGSHQPALAAGFISSFEGCKLTAYRCSAGVITIGFGHTEDVKEGDMCTQEQANAWLIEDIREIQLLLAHYVNVPVTQNEFVALVSLAFNVGVGALMKSKLLRKLNSGDREGAAALPRAGADGRALRAQHRPHRRREFHRPAQERRRPRPQAGHPRRPAPRKSP